MKSRTLSASIIAIVVFSAFTFSNALEGEGWLAQLLLPEGKAKYDYTIDVTNKRFEPAGESSVETQSTQMKFEILAQLTKQGDQTIDVEVSAYHIVVEQKLGSITQFYDSYSASHTGVAERLHESLQPVLESKSNVKVNSSGKILSGPESEDPTGSLNNLVEGLFFDFPTAELKSGDSWVVQRGGETPNPVTMVMVEESRKIAVTEYKMTSVDASSGNELTVNTYGIISFEKETGMIQSYEENQEYLTKEGIKLGTILTKISRN